jgi:hypothetical protein
MLFQLTWPGSADAWWGWIDELTGPKGLHGVQLDARLRCFWTPNTPFEKELSEVIDASAAVDKALGQARKSCKSPWCNSNAIDQLEELISHQTAHAARLLGTYISTIEERGLFGPESLREIDEIRHSLPPTESGDPSQDKDSPEDKYEKAVTTTVKRWLAAVDYIIEPRKSGPSAFLMNGTPTGGVRFSLCKPKANGERLWSITVGARLFWATDTSPEIEGEEEAYAGGHRIYLFAAIPAVELRPLYLRRNFCSTNDCQRHDFADWLDVVDIAAGAGYYRAASQGFRSINGVVLEARANFRLPDFVVRRHGWARLIPQVTLGQLGFVDGFKANAFGPNLTGKKALAKREGWIDWTSETAVFVDLAPCCDRAHGPRLRQEQSL